MQKRNATVAVIGAGDFIGGEIAKKFASEGFTVFAGRRNGAKLEPLVKEIEAAGGEIHARSLDARKEEEIIAFLNDADKHAPLEVCIFNIGANVNFPILETTERVFRKVWEMACYSGFLAGREAARLMLPRGQGNIFFTGATAQPARRTAALRRSPAPNSDCARWRRRPRASWVRRTSMSPISSSIPASTPNGCASGGSRRSGPNALDDPDPLMPPASVAEVLLAALSAAAERLDVRIGNPPVRREVVTGASAMELSLSREDAGVSRRGARLHRGELSAGNARSQSGDRPDQGADAALAPDPVQEGMDRAAVAEGIWRPGLVDHAALHLRTGDVARRNAAAAGVQRDHGRSGHLHLWQCGAEEEVPAADPLRRRLVVPGLFGAGLGLRPGLGPHQGGARRRPLHRQRPQDLDDAGAACRLDLLPGAHRSAPPRRSPASRSC